MSIEFYATDTQPVIGPVVMLPQKGSVSGGSKRPLNSYAIVRDGVSVFFDAPFSWTMDGVRAIAEEHTPLAMVISHRDLAASGDAYQEFRAEFGGPILMHPDDQATEKARELDVPLTDPMGEDGQVLRDAGIEVIHIPGHSPGSIMLYLADEGGILLAGDSAVGPGPEQSDRTPRLERPIQADEDPRFLDTWQKTISRLPVAAVLPLHGEAYLRRDHENFSDIVANIWNGPQCIIGTWIHGRLTARPSYRAGSPLRAFARVRLTVASEML